MSNAKYSVKRHLEFGGAIGASLLVLGLPAAILAINIACNKVFIAMYTGSWLFLLDCNMIYW